MTHSLAEHGLSDVQGISVNWSLAQRQRLLDGTFSAEGASARESTGNQDAYRDSVQALGGHSALSQWLHHLGLGAVLFT